MVRIFAHRGSSKFYAENTRAAYQQAVYDGADGIECDVHLSADGHVVLHHDAVLGRTSNGSGAVRELTLEQLRAFDYSSWKGRDLPPTHGGVGEQLCTLPDLVEIALGAGRPIELAVETKHQAGDDPRLEATVVETLVERGFDPATRRLGDVTVSFMSFEPRAVSRLLGLVDASGVCQLVEDASVGWEREFRRLDERGRPDVAAYEEAMELALRHLGGEAKLLGPGKEYVADHPERVRAWIEAGSTARIWTVDAVKDARRLLELGVTEITSNEPTRMIAALR